MLYTIAAHTNIPGPYDKISTTGLSSTLPKILQIYQRFFLKIWGGRGKGGFSSLCINVRIRAFGGFLSIPIPLIQES